MPIPNPGKKETEQEFVSRCAEKLIGEEGYERDQAVAICYQQLSIKLTADSSWRKQFIASKNPSTWINK